MTLRPRVLIGTIEVAGYYANLTESLQKAGVNCSFVTYQNHPFRYGVETEQFTLIRWYKSCHRLIQESKTSSMKCFFLGAMAKIFKIVWVFYVIIYFDIFIFGFGTSLLSSGRDLILIRLLGKKIISNLAHGSEARPPYLSGVSCTTGIEEINAVDLVAKSRSVKRRVLFHEKYSNIIIGSPMSTSHYSSKSFVNSFYLGIPQNRGGLLKKVKCNQSDIDSDNSNIVKILHSPSNIKFKGTALIIEAIERLKIKGYNIELRLIHGRPFEEVIGSIMWCDFVVDQVYSDTPLAGFATEAAWFNKPAVVGGYGVNLLKMVIPSHMWPPSKFCHPTELEDAIEALIVNEKERVDLGVMAGEFVQRVWNMDLVAERYIRLIKNDIPNDWWHSPSEFVYMEGCGLSVDESRALVRLLISTFGVESLGVSNKPNLECALIKFANNEY